MGQRQLIIGKGEDKDDICVLVKYNDKNDFLCELSTFFLDKNKSECIKAKDIDNSEFTTEAVRKSSGYNKIFNEKILEFIDAININMSVDKCSLIDTSSLKNLDVCGELQLYILKQFERGYSFYNEFGYMYNPKVPDEPYDDYEEIITTANKYLDKLKKINSEMTAKTLHEMFEQKDLYKRNPEFESIKLIFEAYKEILISVLIKDIMNYCRLSLSKNKLPLSKNEKNLLYNYNVKIVVAFIRTIEDILWYIFGQISEINNFTKLYKYPEVIKSPALPVLVSTLVDKSDNTRRFEMQPMKNYKLELKKNEGEETFNEGEETFTLTIETITTP